MTFLNVPSAGSTIAASYTYVAQPAATIAVNPGDIPAGTTNITLIQGTVSLSVANFVSLQGSFTFEEDQPTTGDPILAIGATNVTAVVGTADTNLTIAGASLGMLIQDGHYALKSTAGSVALNGVPDLSISATGLQLEIERGLDPSTFDSAFTTIGSVDLTTLGSADITQVQGSATITVASFVSLSGTFGFTETTTPDTDGKGPTTTILVGASNVSASIGTEDASGTLVAGVQVSGASLGLEIVRDSEATGSTYALQTSAPSIAVVGLPSDFSVTGSASVSINKTGAAVNETIPGGQNISFADGSDIEQFGGSLTLGIAGYTLTGDFAFTKVVDTADNLTKILIGATNVGSPSAIAAGSQGSFQISDGTLGLVLFSDASGTSQGYAMTASATATAEAGTVSAGGTLTILRNTTPNPVNETVVVGTTSIPVVFTASQVEKNGTAYQSVAVGDASLNIDDSLIIAAAQGTTSSPVTGASSVDLTGVTLTLKDPSSSQVFFTISAASAVYTTFTASASQPVTFDGRNWTTSTDVDLTLTNVTFAIGGFVSLSADSLDLQHYTTNGAVTNSFQFTGASLALLDNGSPMVTLTGSPAFHYTTGSSTASDNGFILDSFANPGFKFLDPSATLGPISLTDASVGLSDLSFSPDFSTLSASLKATVTISADATIGSYIKFPQNATTNAPGLSGSFNLDVGLSLKDLSHPTINADAFNITANSVEIDLGTYLKLTGSDIKITPTAGPNQNLLDFGMEDLTQDASLTATLAIPGTSVNLSGSASHFAIEGDGSFVAGNDFSVSFSLGQSDVGNLSWPSWLPIQSATAALTWTNFNSDPTAFQIELSATISGSIAGMTLTGSVQDAVIDPSLAAEGQFPITSVGSLSAGVTGDLFGGTVSGQLIAGVVSYDSNGALVDGLDNLVGTTTPGTAPFHHAMYAGVEAGFSMAGLAGFNIRVGISQLGLLQVYVEADTPIPLGDTGLFLSDFRGGITFGDSFPSIISSPPQASDALKLEGSAFSTPDNLTAAQWQAQLEQQVALQAEKNPSGSFQAPQGPFIIQAGMTLYDGSPDVFELSGDVFFDTSGKFLVIGNATVGGSFTVGAKAFVDLSTLPQSLDVLFLMQVPAPGGPTSVSPIYQIYGFVGFTDANNDFTMTISGEADLNVLGGLKAELAATLTLTFTANSFNVTVSGGQLTIPSIQSTPLGTADASLTIADDNGSVDIWGGFLLTTNLTALNAEGIYSSAQVNIKLNTTDVPHTVTLSNGTLTLDPESFSLFINGTADLEIGGQQVFALDGALTMDISPESLTIFVQASLLLGPDSTKPILTYNANGLIDVQLVEDDSNPSNPIHPGLAAKMTLTEGAGVPNGVIFGENWLMVLNTTESTVTFTIPQPAATNPPSPSIPTVMGPDYSSSNPLALTSYETVTNGVRTLVIPDGSPATGQKDYSNWTPAAANVYFLILGRGSVTVANAFTLSGNINVDASVSGSTVSFTLDVNANMAVNLNGNTVFSFLVSGGIQLSNAGVAAVLDLNVATGVPSSLGFSLTASFMLEVNTTSAAINLDSFDLPAGQAMIAASGDLKLLGGVVDLAGTFNFTVNSTSLTVAVTSHVTFLGATFTADGFAGIYYDSHPGLALDINLALPGGAKGIAPVAALGSNFVVSGDFKLELNTCSVARLDTSTNASIAPGFQVAVNNLGVYVFGFDATGSISIGITNDGFTFTVDISVNIFGIASVGLEGYYDAPNNFSFTGSAGFQFGDHTFGIGGSLSITISSSGFAASVSGWAAAFGLQISASGSLSITGSSVDIEVGFSVTIVPAINIDTPDVHLGFLGTIHGIHIHTAAVVITEYADFHLGSISAPPAVASASPPPPTPPPLAGEVTDTSHNNANALELYVGQDVSNRKNGAGQLTDAQTAENYNLTRVSGDTGSTNGETILVSALGLQQTYYNVQEILVNNTLTGNDTITIDTGIADPVYLTLGSGNNTINTGGGPAMISVAGVGSNQITSGSHAMITISGNGSNQVTAGDDATVHVDGNGNNVIKINSQSSDTSSVTITGTGANHVTDTGGSPTITVASTASGGNSILVNTASASTFNIHGGGSNALTSLGSGPATVTVDGNGNNQITTGGTAGGTTSSIYLLGSGNNQVSTGAGPTDVYDEGTGGNSVSGGSGGGIDYYGVDGQGAAYASKGSSSLSTTYGNFFADVSGYSSDQLSDYDLEVENAPASPYVLGLSGVRSVTLRAASAAAANAFTLANWSGNAALYGVGTHNTLTMVPGASVNGVNEALSDSSLQVSGGVTQTIGLSDIQTANLAGAASGSNRFDVSSWTGNGSLTGLPGTTNTLVATHDVAVSTLSDTLFQRTGDGDMTLSGIQSAILTGGSGQNTFTVNGWSGNATLDGEDGSDTYNLTLSGSGSGTINVADSGSTGTDTLNVTAQRTTFVTSTSVKVGTQGVTYGTSGIEVLNVLGGAAGLTFNVQSTSSSVSATTVQTHGGSNVINVGSTAGLRPYTAGTVNKILGALVVVGDGADTMNVDDTGSTAAKTGTLTASALTGLTMGPSGIAYNGLANLNIGLGSGGTTGNAFSISVASGQNLPASTSIIGGSAVKDSLGANWAGDFNGTLNLSRFNSSAIAVSGNFDGTLNDTNPGTTTSVSIGGSVTSTGVLDVSSSSDPAAPTSATGLLGDIGTMTVGGAIAGQVRVSGDLNALTVGQAGKPTTGGANDVSGQVLVGGQLGSASVSGNVSGTIQEALTINSLYIGGSVAQTGVIKAINAADPANPTSSTGLLGDIGTMTVGGGIAGTVQTSGGIGTLDVGPANQATTGGVNDVSGRVLVGGALTTGSVSGNVSGTIQEALTISSLYIGGSVTSTGTVKAVNVADPANPTSSMGLLGDIGTMTVVGGIAGTVRASGNIGTLTVGGDVSGTVRAGATIGSLTIGSSANAGSVTATGLVSAGLDIGTMLVYANNAGVVQAGATIHTLTVDGSVIPTLTAPPPGTITEGIIRATNIQSLAVGGAMAGLVNASANLTTMSVGQDMAGLINVGQALGQLTVTGGTPGSIIAGTIGTVGTYGGYGAVVAQIKEGGIQRRVEAAAVPSTPYPQPIPLYSYPTSVATLASPAKVNFQYFYEGLGSNNGSLSNPQLTIRAANNSGNTSPDQYDLSLVTWSDTANFNLARLDAATDVNGGISGIRNVAIEGNLLPTVTPAAQAFFNLSAAQGGVRLPKDQLAGVEVRDNAQAGEVTAASIQGLAFGSLTGTSSTGTIVTQTGAVSNQAFATQLLTPTTAVVQAGTVNPQLTETFRVPFDDQPSQNVALFQSDSKNAGLDNNPVIFADEDQGISSGDPRGTVTALVSLNGPALTGSNFSIIQTIALAGDGGSFSTKQQITSQVTSTGPLGDLSFQATQGITANVTAPDIIGNISSSGPITGIIQTTGIWTDMTTGLSSTISADFGRAITDSNGNILSVTTVTSAQGGGIAGELVSRGNLISQISANSGVSGVIAAQGDLGVIQRNSGGQLVRFGGLQSNGTISGQIVTLGNIFGDINITGNLTGRIAANGRPFSLLSSQGILGNINVGGTIGTSKINGAVVSRGEIGDSTLGTALKMTKGGAIYGILAAEGPITLVNPGSLASAYIFSNVPEVPANPNAAAIDAIFEAASGTLITSFDDGVTPLDLANLNQILTDLAKLHAVKNSSGQYVLSDS